MHDCVIVHCINFQTWNQKRMLLSMHCQLQAEVYKTAILSLFVKTMVQLLKHADWFICTGTCSRNAWINCKTTSIPTVTVILYNMQFKQNKNICEHKAKSKIIIIKQTFSTILIIRVDGNNTLTIIMQL